MIHRAHCLLPILLFFLFQVGASAQSNTFTIEGIVSDEQGEPVIMAALVVRNSNTYTLTDEHGKYQLALRKGKYEIEISCLGYRSQTLTINVAATKKKLNITLPTESLAVDGAVVTATQTSSRNGTSSFRMENNAIRQIQTMSVSDILSLLPGAKITPPDLSAPGQANLRSAISTSINSFGTAMIVDGTPINNDANMQSLDPASSSGGTRGNVVNGGVDMRSLPSSNVESVEVITGVPSAKYGNLTSGTVLVTRKAGYTPYHVSVNIMPATYQAGVSKGFQLGPEYGFLNADLDYTYSENSTTDNSLYYQRVGFSTRWTVPVMPSISWTNTLSMNYSFQGDQERDEKDKLRDFHSDTRNQTFSLGLNGHMDVLGKLSYNFNFNLDHQYSYHESEMAGPLPMIEATESGTYFTTYTPLKFKQITSVKGMPVTLYGRVDASQDVPVGPLDFSFLTGLEGNWSRNFGEGRAAIGEAVSASGLPGSRGVEFHDIPASTSISAYEEVDVKYSGDKSEYLLRLGGRYDFMNGRYHLFSPRVSVSARYFGKLRLRAAYGLSYKAPSMMQLYPGPSYFDISNLDYYAPDPAERLAIVTTYKYMPVNDHLRPSAGTTYEIGADWEGKGYYIRLTAYLKNITGGIGYEQSLVALKKDQYNIVEEPVGQPPVVEIDPGNEIYLPRLFNTYTNHLNQYTKGIEWTVAPPQIKASHTSFNLSGAYVRTKVEDRSPDIRSSQFIISGANKYGVYRQVDKIYDKCTANLNIIQQIPSLKMMITLILEMNIYENRKTEGVALYPSAYYDRMGQLHPLTEEQAKAPEFADLVLDPRQYLYERPPFYPNLHMQIRKEMKQGHSFSFFANNCLWINPTYVSEIRRTRTRLNSRISFGFAANFKF